MNIEKEYQKLIDYYELNHKPSKTKGIKKVLQLMYENPKKIWWWSYEFVGKATKKGEFLSHRSPARASDLAIHYPELVEDRRIGKLSVYRLRKENKDQIIEMLNS